MSGVGSYDDYADDGGEDEAEYDEEDVGTTGYVEEVEVETPGYSEVGEANSRDAEGDNGGDGDEHPNDDGSPNPNQEDEDRGDDDGHDEHGGSMSNYEHMKPWGGKHVFMRSYGIKRSPEGYEEARALADTMREMAEKLRNLNTEKL